MTKNIIISLLIAILIPLARANSDFENELLKIWTKTIKEYKSTQDEFNFLEKNRTKIIFLDESNPLISGLVALYENKNIYVNRSTLLDMITELEKQYVSLKEIPLVIAVKTVSFIGHELRHGINEENLDKYGIIYPGALQEDEILAYHKQLQIFEEVKENNFLYYFGDPSYEIEFSDNTFDSLESASSDGLAGMRNFVIGRGYGAGSISDISKFLERLKSNIEMNEKSREKLLKLIEKLENSDDVQDPKVRKRLKELYTYRDGFNSRLTLFKEQLQIISDPVKSKAMQKYYSQSIIDQGIDLLD